VSVNIHADAHVNDDLATLATVAARLQDEAARHAVAGGDGCGTSRGRAGGQGLTIDFGNFGGAYRRPQIFGRAW
jgi:hypothetical protein